MTPPSITTQGSRYPLFDRRGLTLLPLSERRHDLDSSTVLDLKRITPVRQELSEIAIKIRKARATGSSVVLMMGAHVLRDGAQRYLIDLMERGLVDCIAMNGAGVIHDFEFSLIGATTESVARYIQTGQFGLWRETGLVNELVAGAAQKNCGIGEEVGRYIEEGGLPYSELSVLAAGWRHKVPVTVHVGIGYDIVHEHPNCDGGAWGSASYTDFLVFTKVLERIHGGVVMNFGTAVMGPEIFLKALAMVRNKAQGQGKIIDDITSLVCDLKPLPDTCRQEAERDDPFYYFRPWKTMLVRTIAGSGDSMYVRERHRNTIPQLWTALTHT